MNHDNLLAQIDLLAQPSAGSSNNKPSFYKALRAVVERCAPDEQDDIDYGIRSFKERILQDIEEQLK